MCVYIWYIYKHTHTFTYVTVQTLAYDNHFYLDVFKAIILYVLILLVTMLR
jgi:hypothetical protein